MKALSISDTLAGLIVIVEEKKNEFECVHKMILVLRRRVCEIITKNRRKIRTSGSS
jgi:hypothetical protein